MKKKAVKEGKNLASRKSSELIIDSVVKNYNLIGGSADLAGSNNTKTKSHKILTPGNFDGNYTLWCKGTVYAMCGIMNGLGLA